jgi:hypothetical protein
MANVDVVSRVASPSRQELGGLIMIIFLPSHRTALSRNIELPFIAIFILSTSVYSYLSTISFL